MTSWRGVKANCGISHHCASSEASAPADDQHDRDPLLGMVERHLQPVDDEEADHAQHRRLAVAADDADHVPGKHPGIAPAQLRGLRRLIGRRRRCGTDRRIGDDRAARRSVRGVVGKA
jgi:hypothetical protein